VRIIVLRIIVLSIITANITAEVITKEKNTDAITVILNLKKKKIVVIHVIKEKRMKIAKEIIKMVRL